MGREGPFCFIELSQQACTPGYTKSKMKEEDEGRGGEGRGMKKKKKKPSD